MGLQMIKAQGGIFGWVSNSANILAALDNRPSEKKVIKL
jgi:hypothetical protein